MSTRTKSLDEIRRIGLKALARELGPVGAVRFLQQFETGSGDYSVERHSRLGKADVATLSARIKQERNEFLARPSDLALTGRERQILKLVLAGETNRQIAEKLLITIPAVKALLQRLFAETGAENRRELALYARRLPVRPASGHGEDRGGLPRPRGVLTRSR